MIGTGVFTSLGFQVGGLPSGFTILLLWVLGGACALCGALCYSELSAALPRSGGEYHFIGRTLHPMLGFLAGWLSATMGFAAPIALASMALGTYAEGLGSSGEKFVSNLPLGVPQIVGLVTVGSMTLVHLSGLRFGALFQNIATVLKLALISCVIIAGFCVDHVEPVYFLPSPGDAALVASAPFAVSLVFVMYAYSGWNAASYIVGEIRDPVRNVPRALIIGTSLVSLLYVALNIVFLRTTPMAALEGKLEVGLIAGEHIFGPTGGRIVAGFICLGLIASISAMTWIGPRVTATMGEDLRALRWLAVRQAGNIPKVALLTQAAVVAALILTSTFEKVLVYVQFGLTLFSFLAVLGMMILRWCEPELPRPFKTPGYPLTPLVFLAISGWMLWHIAQDKPGESLAGLATVATGLLVYLLSPKTRLLRL